MPWDRRYPRGVRVFGRVIVQVLYQRCSQEVQGCDLWYIKSDNSVQEECKNGRLIQQG